jgi:hypothetical protein
MIEIDNLHWEPTMELRWYVPWRAERIRGNLFRDDSEQIVQDPPRLQQLWQGKATAGSQTVLVKEWRDIPGLIR